jgi:hypothetical protein
MDNSRLERMTVNPKIFCGKPINRGHSLAVEHILSMLAAGRYRCNNPPGISMAAAGGRSSLLCLHQTVGGARTSPTGPLIFTEMS